MTVIESEIDGSSKDALLRSLLQELAARGLARRWALSATPHSDLESECVAIASIPGMSAQITQYLRANPVVALSVHTLLAHLSVTANVRPEHVPWPQQILAPAGSRIARWLPTFLIIDGPLGRFLRSADSPLNVLLRGGHATYPTLAQARDLFDHDLFRRVRNGLGHWAFVWEQDRTGERLACFDGKSGERSVEISLLEGEALHVATLTVVECLDREVFRLAHSSAN